MAEPNLSQQIAENFDNVAKEIANTLSTWKGNFFRNTGASFSNMTTNKWLRLLIIICTYLLIRPHLVKFATRAQEKQLAKHAEAEAADTNAKINANDLRGGKKVEASGIDAESEEESKQQWGKKARVRQRKNAKKAIEMHEQNLRDRATASDHEIEELLED